MVSGASDFGQIPVSGINDLGIGYIEKKGDGLSQTVPLDNEKLFLLFTKIMTNRVFHNCRIVFLYLLSCRLTYHTFSQMLLPPLLVLS